MLISNANRYNLCILLNLALSLTCEPVFADSSRMRKIEFTSLKPISKFTEEQCAQFDFNLTFQEHKLEAKKACKTKLSQECLESLNDRKIDLIKTNNPAMQISDIKIGKRLLLDEKKPETLSHATMKQSFSLNGKKLIQ